MTEVTRKSGAELLEEVRQETLEKQGTVLKNLLQRTLKGIKGRETWIDARTLQIKELKKIQIDLVKCYDSGQLEGKNSVKFEKLIQAVEQDKASDIQF